jgi:hypothetical protein
MISRGNISPGKAKKQAARDARLSAALRENLKRRKAQARARAGQGYETEAAAPDTGGETPAPDFRRNRSRD